MRQANSSIRGYLYQFNKSILEVMSAAEDEQIMLEGVIEDIDVESTNSINTIQCKYHEDKKYQISSVAEAILEMVCHYHESSAIGKNMSYVLYAYFTDNVESIDKDDFYNYISSTSNKEIIISFFHRIYVIKDHDILEIANKAKKTNTDKEKILEYFNKNRNALELCVNFDNFWKCFKYCKADKYDVLCQKVKDKFAEIVDRDTAENLYYPNAFSYISNMSSKSNKTQRVITKKQLLSFLEKQKSILITTWALIALDRNRILKEKKNHLSSSFSLNSDVRAFIFSNKFSEKNSDKIIPFINAYIAKYFKKPKLQKPPIFIFDNDSEELYQKSILSLYKYQKYVNTGCVGNLFVEDNFVSNAAFTDKINCKMTLLKNVTVDLLEECKVNQLYIVGNIYKELQSLNYITEYLNLDNIDILKYLIGLDKTLEVK